MEDEVVDIEDDKFEQLLADKQHRQLMGALRQLISTIKTDNEADNKTSQAITQYNKDLSLLLGRIEKAMDKPAKEFPTPQVNVTNDNKEMAVSIGLLRDGQSKIIELLSLKPKKLKVNRSNYTNLIDYVVVEWETVSKS